MKIYHYILCVGCFGAGFGAGYFVSKKVIQNKADKEVESIKKLYSKEKPIAKEPKQKKEVKKVNKVENNNPKEYNDYAGAFKNEVKESLPIKELKKVPSISEITNNKIYRISAEEYKDGIYDAQTLYFYSDGVVADDDFNPIYEVGELLGTCLPKLDDNDEEVFIRNEDKEIDFEIIKDERKFYDIRPVSHPRE